MKELIYSQIKLKGMTIEDLCKESGIKTQTLYRRLRDGNWSIGELQGLSKALNIPICNLINNL